MTSVGRALKSRKLTPHFVGPYKISENIGEVAYRITLPPSLANLHDVCCTPKFALPYSSRFAKIKIQNHSRIAQSNCLLA